MSHISNPDAVAERFANDLFNPSNIHRLHSEYEASQPYKHVVVDKLFQRSAGSEIVRSLPR